MYKFVELPYNYKPIRSTTILSPKENGEVKTNENTASIAIENTGKPSDFKVTQEPIKGKLSEHVTNESISRVVISKPTPVIVRCGRARALHQKAVP